MKSDDGSQTHAAEKDSATDHEGVSQRHPPGVVPIDRYKLTGLWTATITSTDMPTRSD